MIESSEENQERATIRENHIYYLNPYYLPTKGLVIKPNGQVTFCMKFYCCIYCILLFHLPDKISDGLSDNVNFYGMVAAKKPIDEHKPSSVVLSTLKRVKKEAPIEVESETTSNLTENLTETTEGSTEPLTTEKSNEPVGFLQPPNVSPTTAGFSNVEASTGHPGYGNSQSNMNLNMLYFTTSFPFQPYRPYGKFCPSKVDLYRELLENGFYPSYGWK